MCLKFVEEDNCRYYPTDCYNCDWFYLDRVPGVVCPNEYQEPLWLDCSYCNTCKEECKNDI